MAPSAMKAMMTKADLVIILQILEAVAKQRFPEGCQGDAHRIAQNIRAQVVGT